MSLDMAYNAAHQLGSWRVQRYVQRPHSLVLLTVCFSISLLSYLSVRWVGGNISASTVPPTDHISLTPSSCSPPATPPYSAVIIYLAAVKREDSTISSLRTDFSNLETIHPWPIILFHPGDYNNPDERDMLRGGLLEKIGYEEDALDFLQRIEFVRIYWNLPKGISTDIKKVDPIYSRVWPGYHHMCAFYAYQIFDHPRLQNVTYYLRLDTDSYIVEPACYDPIERIHSRNLSYAYIDTSLDEAWLIQGLWMLVDSYATRREGIEERMIANGFEWPEARGDPEKIKEEKFPLIYNNFEVVRLERFRQPDVREWMKEVASVPERFYKYRWGDAPLRYATIYMFFDVEREVEQFCGMRYDHFGVRPQCACDQSTT